MIYDGGVYILSYDMYMNALDYHLAMILSFVDIAQKGQIYQTELFFEYIPTGAHCSHVNVNSIQRYVRVCGHRYIPQQKSFTPIYISSVSFSSSEAIFLLRTEYPLSILS